MKLPGTFLYVSLAVKHIHLSQVRTAEWKSRVIEYLHVHLIDTIKQLSKVVIPVILPPDLHEYSGCFPFLPILAVVCLFHYDHSSGYLIVLICFSLMTMCLAGFMIPSFMKCLFKPFAHFN